MSHNFHLFGFHHSGDSNISSDTHHHHHHHLFHFNRPAPEVVQPNLDEKMKISCQHNDNQRINVFRILETVWAFRATLVPHYHGDANPDGWAAFDDDSQKRLEDAYKNKTWCVLSDDSSVGAGVIHFEDDFKGDSDDKERIFTYQQDINRMSTPLWRFEKLCPETNTKQMECFEWKNQMRLEAFDDPNATLILTDKAFPHPFTVVLNQAQKKNGEKWQGFMYLNSSPTMNAISSYYKEDHYQDVGVQNMDDFPNFDMNREMEKEQLDEDHYRKLYGSQ